MASWSDRSYQIIQELHSQMPENIAFEDRVKILRDNYPFSMRRGWAYKSWLQEQRKYLAKYAPPNHDSKRFPQSPLERLMAKSPACLAKEI